MRFCNTVVLLHIAHLHIKSKPVNLQHRALTHLTACSTSSLGISWSGSAGDVTTNTNDTLCVSLHTSMFVMLKKSN